MKYPNVPFVSNMFFSRLQAREKKKKAPKTK